MRNGPIAVVAAVVAQVDLQNLAQLLEQRERFLNGGLTHGGVLTLDPIIEMRGAGVTFAGCDDPDKG